MRNFRAFLLHNPYICKNFKYINMGRGDKKTAKGKRFQGSFGKSRPAKPKKAAPKKKEEA